jgi:alpha-D-ribose 1-methylphosphonate 5-triphosphate diphosphatase PhnM
MVFLFNPFASFQKSFLASRFHLTIAFDDYSDNELVSIFELQCRKTARAVGLMDRGVIAPGYRQHSC